MGYTSNHYPANTPRMTVDEFLAWSQDRPGRFELLYGVVYEMQAERRRHAKVKFAVQRVLYTALRDAGSPCEILPDGMAVRMDRDGNWFEPDALIHCDTIGDLDAIEIANPIVVVEVLSPSRSFDMSYKLAGYFSIPSVVHYLVVDPVKLPVIHHARQTDGTILTRFVESGLIKLDPPGIEFSVDALLD